MAGKHLGFKFYDSKTDECVYECKARQGAMNRAKIYLFKGAEPMSAVDSEAFYGLWGFMSAAIDGHPLVEMPEDMRNVKRETVFGWMDEYGVYVDIPADDADAVEDGTENPTGI